MGAYYNEIDPYCAQWLRNLIDAGLIAPGEVDERDIREVTPGDLQGFTQCHFFAGIGGWSLALRLAGWDDSRSVWTGSCPCQPFSNAGKRKGADDERDLWPVFDSLIRECRPDQVFGEQVASAVNDGWLDRICADMEAEGYAIGAAVLGAHSVGAPHIRQRLWWVADAGHESEGRSAASRQAQGGRAFGNAAGRSPRSRMADSELPRSARLGEYSGPASTEAQDFSPITGSGAMGSTISAGLQGRGEANLRRPWGREEGRSTTGAGSTVWVQCRDGKARRIEPGITPLAHGVSARVGKLRAYGNAIVPQVAAEFIAAYMEAA